MKLDTVENIIETLQDLLESTLSETDVKNKQNLVWGFAHNILNTNEDFISEDIDEILGDLAVDLHSYEPYEPWRKEDHSYYDDEGLKKEIEDTINKLRILK